jgi:hypothetical protein
MCENQDGGVTISIGSYDAEFAVVAVVALCEFGAIGTKFRINKVQ